MNLSLGVRALVVLAMIVCWLIGAAIVAYILDWIGRLGE